MTAGNLKFQTTKAKLLITKAHSLLQKILPNSTGQFVKFCGLSRQNWPNSTAYRDLLLVCKIRSILLKNVHFLEAGMVLSYASNIQRKLSIFFLFKSAICQLVALCLFNTVPYYDGNY